MHRRGLSLLVPVLLLQGSLARPGDFEQVASETLQAIRESFAVSVEEIAAEAPAERKSMVLRVLTYNIQGLPSEGPNDQFAGIGSILAARRNMGTAPHIVAIQEAFHPRTDDLVEESGYPYFRYGAPATSDSPLSSGLIILSEFPIESAATIDYRECTGADCWANKGALYAKIIIPGLPKPLAFFNTHMNAGSGDGSAAARADQIAQATRFLGAMTEEGSPILFPGDFNFWPTEAEYALLAGYPGFHNAEEDCFISRSCTGSGDPEKIWREEVDHQFFTSAPGEGISLRPTHLEQTFKDPINGKPPSDHLGLEVHYHISWPSQ